MINLRYLFIFFSLLCFSDVPFAAEEDPAKKQLENEKNTKKPKATTGKRGQIKTLKEFIPSEEVSADKPVAFPNDI